jgi:hypothetical protein
MPGKGRPDVVRRDLLDVLRVAIEVVERQSVEADERDVVEDLAVAVEAQGKAADQILFCRPQFGRRSAPRR